MKNIILHVLCEGPTEELFVKNVLVPYFNQYSIFIKSQLLHTNKKKEAQGGVVSYLKIKKELLLMIDQFVDKESEEHYFTTMIDFYGLPKDTPFISLKKQSCDKYTIIKSLENEFANDIKSDKFIPYLQLHEFEALVLCGLDIMIKKFPNATSKINQLKKDVDKYSTMELVNDSIHTAPSKRIEAVLQKNYHYNKPKDGIYIVSRIEFTVLRERCPHFNEWIGKIEGLRMYK